MTRLQCIWYFRQVAPTTLCDWARHACCDMVAITVVKLQLEVACKKANYCMDGYCENGSLQSNSFTVRFLRHSKVVKQVLNWSSIPLSYTLHQKCVTQLSLQHHFMSSSVCRPVSFVSLCCGFFHAFYRCELSQEANLRKQLIFLYYLSCERYRLSLVYCVLLCLSHCFVWSSCYKEKAGKLDPFNGQVLAQ